MKGFPGNSRPTIGDIAERLCVEHHTTVGLVDKLEERGLVRRERGTEDCREVFLELTAGGTTLLRCSAPSSGPVAARGDSHGERPRRHLVRLRRCARAQDERSSHEIAANHAAHALAGC